MAATSTTASSVPLAGCSIGSATCSRTSSTGTYPAYTLTFTGQSLSAGVAVMLTMVVVLNLDKLDKVERGRTRCYAMAPARCMSLNLAVRYADVINSVVLQVTH